MADRMFDWNDVIENDSSFILLPEEAEFSYEVVRGVIEGGATTPVQTTAKTAQPVQTTAQTPSTGARMENPSALSRAVVRAAATPAQSTPQQSPNEAAEGPQEAAQGGAGNASAKAADAGQAAGVADAQYAGLPDALVRMMQEAGVTPNEVRYVIAQKGIYPANTPWAVICGNEQFMQGWLMHPQVWPKVVEMAKQIRDEVPF